jgi:hypothetical protein
MVARDRQQPDALTLVDERYEQAGDWPKVRCVWVLLTNRWIGHVWQVDGALVDDCTNWCAVPEPVDRRGVPDRRSIV